MISKIFHYIWLNSTLPPHFESNINKWKSFYSDYEFKLWSDNDLSNELFKDCSTLLCNNQIHWACKSDIMRYYILQKYGGWYIDTDTYPVKRMPDSFNQDYEFIAAFYEHQIGVIGNSIMGAEKESTFINKILKNLRIHLKLQLLDTRIINRDTCFATGPEYISKIYYQNRLKTDNKVKILEYFYFYPKKINEHYKILNETYAVHENNGSWQNYWCGTPSGNKIIL